VFGNYALPMGLSVGLGPNFVSGTPLTALASLPPYGSCCEVPLTPRGEGFETVDGFRKRTPFESQIDLHVSHSFDLGGNRRIRVLAEAFNLFSVRRPINYNDALELFVEGGRADWDRERAFRSPRKGPNRPMKK
jgi:hypothetical protein